MSHSCPSELLPFVPERTARSASWNEDHRGDAELLVDARRDPEAFGEFYGRNFKEIIGFFWKRTRDRDVASDLAAETFAAALVGVERYNPNRGEPRQWLYGIASNQLKKFWRLRRISANTRRSLAIQTPPTATTGWEEIEAADARLDGERLAAALARVPTRCREAVRLRIVEQYDYSAIAEELNCTPRAARDLVFRGLRHLRDEFDAPPGKEDKL